MKHLKGNLLGKRLVLLNLNLPASFMFIFLQVERKKEKMSKKFN